MEQIFDYLITPLGKLCCVIEQNKISLLHPNASLIPSQAQKTFTPSNSRSSIAT